MNKKIGILFILLAINSLFANVNVVVSILPQQTFVEKIGGAKVNVTTMVKPGSDPHSYEPKPSQMKAISKADVYFPIKLEFENTWLNKFSEHNQKMQLSDMTKGIKYIAMAAHSHAHGKQHHQKGGVPYEWAGIFELQKGIYHWSFAKVDGKYADPAMKFLMIQAAQSSDVKIEKYENHAKKVFATNNTMIAKDGNTLTSKDGYYQLHFTETQNETLFILEIKKSGKYLFFTEHMPLEFKDKEHYFKDMSKNDIEAIATQPENEAVFDPHTWTSPENVNIMAKNIYNTLVTIDSTNEAYYRKNYNNFLQEIAQTDAKIKNIFSSLPKGSKFMVFHPSWGYFAKDYGLIQLAIEVEGKEPKPRMLEKIIKKASVEGIKAIFAQKEFSDKSAKALATELNIKVIKETPLAKEWSDNLIKMADAIANNN